MTTLQLIDEMCLLLSSKHDILCRAPLAQCGNVFGKDGLGQPENS